MGKDKVVLLVIISLLVGFVTGAVTGIWYSSKDLRKPAMPSAPSGPPAERLPSPEDVHLMEDVLKKDPDNLNALISLGNLYFDSSQYKKAIDMYQRALKIDPNNADVRTDMAIMYRGLKDYDRAVKELGEAAARDPHHVNSRYNLGIILLHDKNDIKGAVGAWEGFLKAEPTGPRADTVRKQLEQLRAVAK
jgi:cytochrome c-type biogenesis protein CcmH/NrfG